ncbi:hypothetical protein ACKI1I_00050 [Streptomyces turgidiscabies]|uniref:Uncharacterized protein n=1 Tax=Streptomyces turgidiscabies (strain Car8) TaxID=698760 RepID=L7FAW4_STRT8|nr:MULTISPECIES: hypothetical protein [Streptomyces]ELP68269.1 hypothetical protein STRTUCAR8_04927 [Streptomyces turgidiscabies Car8]MDX3492726.1 hypothetical protein [Streptomyces turgidiscabies]GAQ75702.1 hypothetical protein T45_07490 [Streptomyces turgidiscabies]
MGFEGQVWRLERDKVLLGEIMIEDADFPWLSGRFVPEPAFAAVEPWFSETLALLDAERYDEFEDTYDRISRALTLVAPSGPVAEFLLHIQGSQAWFRWSDEPFGES